MENYHEKLKKTIGQEIGTSEFVFGMKWNPVPIRHDIMRNEYWVYIKNEDKLAQFCLDSNPIEKKVNGVKCFVHQFYDIPTEEESKTLEWKTIDLVNNISMYSSKYSYKKTKEDIFRAVKNKKLNGDLLVKFTEKYGTEFTKNIMRELF